MSRDTLDTHPHTGPETAAIGRGELRRDTGIGESRRNWRVSYLQMMLFYYNVEMKDLGESNNLVKRVIRKKTTTMQVDGISEEHLNMFICIA